MGFFQFELMLSGCGSTANRSMFTVTVRGWTLDVRI